MRINRVKNIKAKWNRRTFETNFYVNDQHHAQKRRFERQMMNRIIQNNQLFSKSFFDDKQINHFFRNRYEMKIFFCSFSTNWNNELCHETQINHEMKKFVFRSFFVVFVNYEKNHIYRMLRFNEIIIVSRLLLESRKSEKNHFFSFLKHWQNDRSRNQSHLRRKNKFWNRIR
jgi:hypothetical protein